MVTRSPLILMLPSRPNAVHVRVCYALKAMGCAALRDGAYLPPAQAPQAKALAAAVADVEANGCTVSLLHVCAPDAALQQSFRALFDRSEAYTRRRGTRSRASTSSRTRRRRRTRPSR